MSTALMCPACPKTPLKHYTDHEQGGSVHHCEACWGMWFDGHALHEFMHSKRLQSRFMVGSTAAEPAESVGYTIDTRTRKCPKCHFPLSNLLYCGIELDSCKQCKGLWFDDGELNRVLHAHNQHHPRVAEIDDELDNKRRVMAAAPLAAAEVAHKVEEEARHLPDRLKSMLNAVAHFLKK